MYRSEDAAAQHILPSNLFYFHWHVAGMLLCEVWLHRVSDSSGFNGSEGGGRGGRRRREVNGKF